MDEKFNKVISIDLSRVNDREAKVILDRLFPGLFEEVKAQITRRELTVSDVMMLLSDGMSVSVEEVAHILKVINAFAPGAVSNIVMRAIALEMDKNYPDNIAECDEVYAFNQLDAKIYRQPTKDIYKKAWRYFAAFRNQEDAIKAVKLTQAVRHAVL